MAGAAGPRAGAEGRAATGAVGATWGTAAEGTSAGAGAAGGAAAAGAAGAGGVAAGATPGRRICCNRASPLPPLPPGGGLDIM